MTSNAVPFDETTNHASAVLTYDAADNVTNDGVNSYVFDAESRIATVNGVSYIYDAEGRRVGKSNEPVM